MLKVALLAAAVALATTAATATDAAVDSATTSTVPAESPCRPGPAPDLGCPLHPADVAPAELAGLATLDSAAIDGSPARPGGDIAFKDAAADTGSVLPASVDRDRSQRLAPALLALGALVILLRRRPT